jgi:hypothetical protein
MRSVTFYFDVEGDTYKELVEKSEDTISRFINSEEREEPEDDDEPFDKFFGAKVVYDLDVHKADLSMLTAPDYEANVVARIRFNS